MSQELRDDLQDLVGERLDPDQAQRLHDRLAAELSGYSVRRRISRGRESERIRVIFIVGKPDTPRWIDFAPSTSKFVYHSDLKWGGVLDIPMGGGDHRVTLGLVGDNDDGLVEDYFGYRVRLESRKVATERLGLSLEFSDFRPTWRDQTLSAAALDPRIAEVYRERRTIEPLVTFALSPRVRVTAWASVTELKSLLRSADSQMASTANLSIGYDQRWELASGASHEVEASYALRAATTVLESDLDYDRHLVRARYRYRHGRNTVIASVALGCIGGAAPLFERFSLGDAATLRGWSKFRAPDMPFGPRRNDGVRLSLLSGAKDPKRGLQELKRRRKHLTFTPKYAEYITGRIMASQVIHGTSIPHALPSQSRGHGQRAPCRGSAGRTGHLL